MAPLKQGICVTIPMIIDLLGLTLCLRQPAMAPQMQPIAALQGSAQWAQRPCPLRGSKVAPARSQPALQRRVPVHICAAQDQDGAKPKPNVPATGFFAPANPDGERKSVIRPIYHHLAYSPCPYLIPGKGPPLWTPSLPQGMRSPPPCLPSP